MLAPQNFTLSPTIFLSPQPDVPVVICEESEIEQHLPSFFESITDGVIGLAPLYTGQKHRFDKLAIASRTHVLIITLRFANNNAKRNQLPPEQSLRSLLCHSPILKCAFQMDNLAASLFLGYGNRITNAKDLLSLSRDTRDSFQSFVTALGGETNLNKVVAQHLHNCEGSSNSPLQTLALQAWAALSSAVLPSTYAKLKILPVIDTKIMDKHLLKLAATEIQNELRQVLFQSFKKRSEIGRGKYNQASQARSQTKERLDTTSVELTENTGRDRQTRSAAIKSQLMLDILQKKTSLETNPFACKIFLKKDIWENAPELTPLQPEVVFSSEYALNESQVNAVKAIMSNDDDNRAVVVHGPPGTGKSNVIAASVTSMMAQSYGSSDITVWLIAHSNVAMKNMAESLSFADFVDFKILATKDFSYKWSGSLFQNIEANVIRSDDFNLDFDITKRQLSGSKVILCTLDMLCNDALYTITSLVPLQTVIIDEANQIEVGKYLPMIIRFGHTLQKMVFVGDDKQLAPFNTTNDFKDPDSVFDIPHLRKCAFFLDTQYRMPVPIGDFISQNMYNGQLKSKHSVRDPKCCTFIDVSNGVEEAQGSSWKNTREIDVTMAIVKQLTDTGRSFQIITPYNPQRALLEKALKEANLPWQDKCCNIETFQGKEADYIVLSLVRSSHIGCLQGTRRVNVMLTRCKKGMFICTSRKFLEGPAAQSLVGELRASLLNSPWLDGEEVECTGIKFLS